MGLVRSVTRRMAAPSSIGSVEPVAKHDESPLVEPSRIESENCASWSPLCTLRGVTVCYPSGATGIDDVSFDVRPGEIVGVVGRNGSGKTTLLRSIAGFPRSEKVRVSGQIVFAGRRLSGRYGMRGRETISLVPEREKIFSSLSVGEQLRIAGNGRSDRDFGLSLFPELRARIEAKGASLSGGQRQMLALAMAWSRRPELLLVDELSLGLAPAAIDRLMKSLLRMRDEMGAAIVVVDQVVSLVLDIADQMLLLDRGAIVMSGSASSMSIEDLREKMGP